MEMNLSDYAYNQDDRWYIDPNVSLGEQDAFINNLRAAQAQDNAQIEAQTRALGTQVPSQLGGLTGAGSYFRSRYQTPQTNQTVADLRAAMQAQAVNDALQNEYKKAKKLYKDAQNAATKSGGGGGNGNTEVEQKDNGAGDKLEYKLEDTKEVYTGEGIDMSAEENRGDPNRQKMLEYAQNGDEAGLRQWLKDNGYSGIVLETTITALKNRDDWNQNNGGKGPALPGKSDTSGGGW